MQGLLELAGLPYVGSGVVGSAVGMDKVMMKRAFAACGLPIATYASFRDGHDRVAFAGQVEAELGYPCFVKPANLGSSVGVSKAHDRASFDAALDLALSFDEWAIVEEAIDGREIEVAVLGDDPPEASVPGEIVPGDEFYSYADKYEHEEAQVLVPAPLTPARSERRARARRAGVRGMSMRGDGSRRLLPRRDGRRTAVRAAASSSTRSTRSRASSPASRSTHASGRSQASATPSCSTASSSWRSPATSGGPSAPGASATSRGRQRTTRAPPPGAGVSRPRFETMFGWSTCASKCDQSVRGSPPGR